MQLSQESHPSQMLVRSYVPGTFMVQDKTYHHGLLLSAKTCDAWSPDRAINITEADIQVLAERRPHLILIGTGEKQVFLPPALLRPLVEAQIGFEMMDTAAACRTFAIVANEGRDVLAALCPW